MSNPKKARKLAPLRTWLSEPMTAEVKDSIERLRALPGVERLAVMPDVHLGEGVCVGVVLGTRGRVYPAGVGGDIGCGITTAALRGDAAPLGDEKLLREVLVRLRDAVPIMRHRSLVESPELPPGLEAGELSSPKLGAASQRMGRVELGTLGRGNHFLEVQIDAEGCAWIMVHSGSRAMGPAIVRHHLLHARRAPSGVMFLDSEEEQGRAYIGDAAWACRYAAASRAAMVRTAAGVVTSLTGMTIEEGTMVDCNHNHVREEEHFGERLLVHRKGASPAGEGEAGLIPGAMGRESFHVMGRGEPGSLRSSSHGAGRAMSRTEARRVISARRLAEDAAGVVFDVRLGERMREEAASAYKDIRRVMRAQRELVRITGIVRGVVCYKGGD